MEKNHSHKPPMVLKIIGMAIGGIFIGMALALLFGIIVKLLWNWLMPTIFGLTAITFWQAWGLVVLSHILFKSFPHHNPHDNKSKCKKKVVDYFGCEKSEEQVIATE